MKHKRLRWLALLPVLLFLGFPADWLRGKPSGDSQNVDAAVILGFGYEETAVAQMLPGAANAFMLDWALAEFPQVALMFVQEGVWVTYCAAADETCFVDGVELRRIDRHDPNLDLHTLDIAACTIERMNQFGVETAVLISHDLQLARAAANFERVKADLCPDCRFVIPQMPHVPYPQNSVQWRTRSQFVYKFSELAARILYSPLLARDVPQTCPAPMPGVHD